MAGVGLLIILVAMALLVVTGGEGEIAGLSPGDFAQVASIGALGLVLASFIVQAFRGRVGDGFRAIAFWLVLGLGFVALYSYRSDVQAIAGRLTGELLPGQTTEGPGGEVVVTRRIDGTFVVNGRIGARNANPNASFIFDTGASTVVLTAETAAAAGFEPRPGDFTVPVSTANGRTFAAPVTLERLAVGSISERNVRALVARPGVLRTNLLGMTFLERLTSYEVRANRLFLRGRGTTT